MEDTLLKIYEVLHFLPVGLELIKEIKNKNPYGYAKALLGLTVIPFLLIWL